VEAPDAHPSGWAFPFLGCGGGGPCAAAGQEHFGDERPCVCAGVGVPAAAPAAKEPFPFLGCGGGGPCGAAGQEYFGDARPCVCAGVGGPAAAETASTGPKVHVGLSQLSLHRSARLGNDMQGVQNCLTQALASGQLKSKLVAAIHGVTGLKPELADIKVKAEAIRLFDFQQCGSHMSKIMKSFTVGYTRRQAPIALYNECTNFMTKMSFSHDYVLDARDATKCRKATRKFALRWKLGESLGPKDFEPMCHNFCEAKFGDDAPQCSFDVDEGAQWRHDVAKSHR